MHLSEFCLGPQPGMRCRCAGVSGMRSCELVHVENSGLFLIGLYDWKSWFSNVVSIFLFSHVAVVRLVRVSLFATLMQ